MFSSVRKRLTYANVVVTFALVFAMSGGAYAASKFLITSTKQISPKVLKGLQGKAGLAGKNGANGVNGAQGAQGPAGAAGAKGETGAQGPEGKEGKQGTPGVNGTTGFTETLPKGKTLMGDWSFGPAVGGIALASVSFGIPLESAPIPIYVKIKEGTPEHCTGDVASPGAEPGFLCVFARQEEGIIEEPEPGLHDPKICSNDKGVSNTGTGEGCALSGTEPADADPFGFDVTAVVQADGFALGTWAVTAQ
jgi:hypothetical protein